MMPVRLDFDREAGEISTRGNSATAQAYGFGIVGRTDSDENSAEKQLDWRKGGPQVGVDLTDLFRP